MDSQIANAATPVKANTQKASLDRKMEAENTDERRHPPSTATIDEGEESSSADDQVSNPQSATNVPQSSSTVAAAAAASIAVEDEEPVVILEMDVNNTKNNSNNNNKKKKSKRRSNNSNSNNNKSSSSSYKTRKRGRKVPIAVIQDLQSRERSTFPPLPRNQYETILRRRAVRKASEKPNNNNNNATSTIVDSSSSSFLNNDEYGDVSLGMKLTVVGGRVIVQQLSPLADGRASPAQLTGMIQRGDVLLAIGNVSLVQLPIDKLMGGLSPLSSPGPDGKYQEVVRVRLESKVGLEPLRHHEEAEQFKKMALGQPDRMDPATEMFALFPMADQLSGAPLLYTQPYLPEFETNQTSKQVNEEKKQEEEDPAQNDIRLSNKSPNSIISSVIASETKVISERSTSEFFEWSEKVSKFMKEAVQLIDPNMKEDQLAGLTQTERTELGKRVMKLAKVLSFTMEDMDKGKDLRSFKIWSSNFSLRSHASARRRYVMDTVSLRSGRNDFGDAPAIDESDEEEGDSDGEDGSGSLDEVDGDELLLGLAARDDVWQKQVIEFLKESIEKMEQKLENGEDDDDDDEKSSDEAEAQADISAAISKELGTFLFGENMTKVMKKKNKRSYVIPPEEITTVLFDLTTILSTAAPDEITVLGPSVNQSFQSSLVSAGGGKSKSARRTNVLLANQYLLNQALPVWLESFRPLPWEQRRVLWPRNSGGSVVPGGTIPSDDDDLTLDESYGSSSIFSKQSKTKDIREIIEDQELDIETRSETCFLVTYYFTQYVLEAFTIGHEEDIKTAETEATAFIQKYGAYLQLHTSLSSSAAANAAAPIKELLKLAKCDPTHREAMRDIKTSGSLVFYDMRKLSAVTELLNSLRYQEDKQQRELIRNMSVSAYPDLRPWQVRKACLNIDKPNTRLQMTDDESWLMDYYYEYLSMLLHPQQGNDAARMDTTLVKEYCEWSIGILPAGMDRRNANGSKRRENFFRVAARSSSDHLSYRRDLETLLKLSMQADEHELALDLGSEILSSKKLLRRTNISEVVLAQLRIVALQALEAASKGNGVTESNGFQMLKRVLKLFQDMSSNEIEKCRDAIVVPDELYSLFQHWKTKSNLEANDAQMLKLLDFVNAHSAPEDVLKALVKWSQEYSVDSSMNSRLEELLQRGVEVAMKSGQPSLFRLQQARQGYSEENQMLATVDAVQEKVQGGIWSRLETGDLLIEK